VPPLQGPSDERHGVGVIDAAGVVKVMPSRQLSGASAWTPQRRMNPSVSGLPLQTAGVPSGYYTTHPNR